MNVVSIVYKQQATKSTYHVLNEKSVIDVTQQNAPLHCEIWRSLFVTASAAARLETLESADCSSSGTSKLVMNAEFLFFGQNASRNWHPIKPPHSPVSALK